MGWTSVSGWELGIALGLDLSWWQNGKMHPECWTHREIQDPLWCPPQENGEENLNRPASQVHLLLLWQDQDEETSCGHLALWFLHENIAGGAWTYTPLLLSQKSLPSED